VVLKADAENKSQGARRLHGPRGCSMGQVGHFQEVEAMQGMGNVVVSVVGSVNWKVHQINGRQAEFGVMTGSRGVTGRAGGVECGR